MGGLIVLAHLHRRGNKLAACAIDRLGHAMQTRGQAHLGTRELRLKDRPPRGRHGRHRAARHLGRLLRSALHKSRLWLHLRGASDGAVDLLDGAAFAQVHTADGHHGGVLLLIDNLHLLLVPLRLNALGVVQGGVPLGGILRQTDDDKTERVKTKACWVRRCAVRSATLT